ncbi:MAG: phosphopantothenoylcysteine decarboxylase, partial [Actinobacteria bacterium]|nr:phosphopantothenoylcysteine decarboxylase [Actinomycetota bacterium]
AAAAAARGASTLLVTTQGPVALPGVIAIQVDTAEEMADAVLARYDAVDVVIMAAAVADFRPKLAALEKIKKREGVPEIVLEPTPDILAVLGERKGAQVLVGFAAETERLREDAAEKLAAKRVDLMVANDVRASDSGFEVDTNRAVLLDSSGASEELPLLTKVELAEVVWDRVARIVKSRS